MKIAIRGDAETKALQMSAALDISVTELVELLVMAADSLDIDRETKAVIATRRKEERKVVVLRRKSGWMTGE